MSPSTAVVPLDTPVLTLKGACQPKAGTTTPPAGCVSSLTRGQFEKLTKALTPADRPAMPPDVLRNFATQYAKLLTFADAAREMGLENDPRVEQILIFAKNQILTETLNQHITEEYSHPTDQQVEAYYNTNMKKYNEATLLRIIVPKANGAVDNPKRPEEEEKAYAEQIKVRWVAGEDPDNLQKEASEHAKAPGGSPSVNMGPRRPGTLPDAHESAFDLKPGETSEVFSDPAAFYIYKVVSVRQVPLSEVKTTISSTLSRQEITNKIQQIQNSVTPELNEAYFGPPRTEVPSAIIPARPPRGGPPAPGAGAPPPAPPAQQPQPPPAPPQ
jgi:DNA polymerase III gamma/tau subunit